MTDTPPVAKKRKLPTRSNANNKSMRTLAPANASHPAAATNTTPSAARAATASTPLITAPVTTNRSPAATAATPATAACNVARAPTPGPVRATPTSASNIAVPRPVRPTLSHAASTNTTTSTAAPASGARDQSGCDLGFALGSCCVPSGRNAPAVAAAHTSTGAGKAPLIPRPLLPASAATMASAAAAAAVRREQKDVKTPARGQSVAAAAAAAASTHTRGHTYQDNKEPLMSTVPLAPPVYTHAYEHDPSMSLSSPLSMSSAPVVDPMHVQPHIVGEPPGYWGSSWNNGGTYSGASASAVTASSGSGHSPSASSGSGTGFLAQTTHNFLHTGDTYVRGCDFCEQRQALKREQELAQLQQELASAKTELKSYQKGIVSFHNQTIELQKQLTRERARAEEAVERTKGLLVDKIGNDLASTQHNLASSFPPNNKLCQKYKEIMTTGARQDLIDSMFRVWHLRTAGGTNLPKPPDPAAAAAAAARPLDPADEYTLAIENYIGRFIVDMHVAVDSLFGNLSRAAGHAIIGSLPHTTADAAPALDAPWAVEPLKDLMRAHHLELFECLKPAHKTTPPTHADTTDTTTLATLATLAAVDAKDAKHAKDVNDGATGDRYLDGAPGAVRFVVERSDAATHILAFLSESTLAAAQQQQQQQQQSKRVELVAAIKQSYEHLEQFVAECTRLLWMLNLTAVPRIALDVAFDPTDTNTCARYHHHVLTPASNRKTLLFSCVIYPPLVSLADSAVLVPGVAI